MKKNMKVIRAAEPAPIDSIDVIDRIEFEERLAAVMDYAAFEAKMLREEMDGFKKEIKKAVIIGGCLAAVISAAIIFRKGD